MKKQMTRDEHGYINERGASKYWGVTTSRVGGERLWVVNFQPSWNGGVTCGYRAKNFKLKEVDAARVAAFLYEAGSDEKYRNKDVYILTADKKYVISINLDDTWLLRQKPTNQTIYQFQPNLTLPLGDEETPVAAPVVVSLGPVESFARERSVFLKDKEEAKEVEKILDTLESSPSERDLISMVTDAVLNKSVSERSARVMISILEQAAR